MSSLKRHTITAQIKQQINYLLLGVASMLSCSNAALAQCELLQLANPSFEVGNAGAMPGWMSFGSVGQETSLVDHGNRALRLQGANTGTWALSAVWQAQTASSGQRWRVRAKFAHPADDPVTGAAVALINIEFRDANDILLDYDSFHLLDSDSPTDTYLDVDVSSQPLPQNTATVRILIGLLQSPAQESGTVLADSIYVEEITGTPLAAQQWGDFPSGRTVDFSGYRWRVKGGGFYGPGPNLFSDLPEDLWVDAHNQLQMRIQQKQGNWYSTEVASENIMGYGDYRLTVKGRIDDWPDNLVFGFFHWQYPRCYDDNNPWNLHNEMDLEISRWNDSQADNAQFIVQPYQQPGTASRFALNNLSDDELITFAYRWLPDRIEYRAWRGGANAEATAAPIHSWTYAGPYLPREDLARVHFNFWQFQGPPADGQDRQITLSEFIHEPLSATEILPIPVMPLPAVLLLAVGLFTIWHRKLLGRDN